MNASADTRNDDTWIPVITDRAEKGLVSVVIPTYNRAYVLRSAIDSVLAQTYRPVEILIADDGSTDGTRQIVEQYGPPVRYLHQPNAGVSAARNLALRHARGEFVALLDSDDWWREWKLEVQVALLRARPEVGMVWTDMSAVNDGGQILHEHYLRKMYSAYQHVRIDAVCQSSGLVSHLVCPAPPSIGERAYYVGDFGPHMLLGSLVHTSTVLVRRERLATVGGFDESLEIAGEDYDFHLRTCLAGPVAFIDAASTGYRVGAHDQLTVNSNEIYIARNTLATLLRWLDRSDARVALPEAVVEGRLARCHAWLGKAELSQGNGKEARRHLWRTLRLNPTQPRLLALVLLSWLPYSLYLAAQRWAAVLRGPGSARRRARQQPGVADAQPLNTLREIAHQRMPLKK